ncbi:MAG: hypothetical protein ACQCN6_03165 [Candidatus Bathyarchaeia archaeon]|jgi:hypothetical protein
MNTEELKAIPKGSITEAAKNLTKTDIEYLVMVLSEKDDKLRYNAFLLLQANSHDFPHVYEHWDKLEEKLFDDNSYQRSIGLMLIAENVRWDKEGKFSAILNKYMECCADEKFITSRQAIQALANVVEATSVYNDKIKQALIALPLDKYKPNQQNLLKKDTANILIEKKQR